MIRSLSQQRGPYPLDRHGTSTRGTPPHAYYAGSRCSETLPLRLKASPPVAPVAFRVTMPPPSATVPRCVTWVVSSESCSWPPWHRVTARVSFTGPPQAGWICHYLLRLRHTHARTHAHAHTHARTHTHTHTHAHTHTHPPWHTHTHTARLVHGHALGGGYLGSFRVRLSAPRGVQVGAAG
jgi:hypothetical protein